jgi:FkbM family methyltransferase
MSIVVKYFPYQICIADDVNKRQIWLAPSSRVYTNDMVNSFDYFFSAVAPSLVDGYQVADYSVPRWHEIIGFDTHPIFCPSLGEKYITVQQYLDFAELQKGQTVLDLGGYTGLTAIAFSKAIGPTGRVILLEPDPTNFLACKKNITLHKNITKLDNITLLQIAVSDTTGKLQFSAESSMGSSALSFVGNGRGNSISVSCYTLSDLLREIKFQVDFIKMDIEGSELGVVRGSRAFFLEHRPRVIMEAHYVNGRVCDNDLISLFTDYHYKCDSVPQPNVVLPLITAVPLEV